MAFGHMLDQPHRNGVSEKIPGPPHFPMDGGDGELRTSVYPSNFAPIAAKLQQRAFQTICKFRFFDADFFFFEKMFFSEFFSCFFHYFRQIFEELGFF